MGLFKRFALLNAKNTLNMQIELPGLKHQLEVLKYVDRAHREHVQHGRATLCSSEIRAMIALSTKTAAATDRPNTIPQVCASNLDTMR